MCQSCKTKGNKLVTVEIYNDRYKVCKDVSACIQRRDKLMALVWKGF